MARFPVGSAIIWLGVTLAMTTQAGPARADLGSPPGGGARLDRKVLREIVDRYRRNHVPRQSFRGITKEVEIPGTKAGAGPVKIRLRREVRELEPGDRGVLSAGARQRSAVQWTIQGKTTTAGIVFLNAGERRAVVRALKGLLPEGESLMIQRPDVTGFRQEVVKARRTQQDAERIASMTPLERTIVQMSSVSLMPGPSPTSHVREVATSR